MINPLNLLLILAIIMITVGYMKSTIYKQEKNVEYRVVDSYIVDENAGKIFQNMFIQSDPWMNRYSVDQALKNIV
jgi:hypothetical protein